MNDRPMAHVNPAVLNSTQATTRQPKVKLIVCATPRSASTTLVRLLESAKLGYPTEYFHHRIVPWLAQKWGISGTGTSITALAHYQDLLYRHAQQNDIFAVKLHFSQFRKFLMNPVGRDLFADAKVVFLMRSNLAQQAASLIVAQQTKHFQADDSTQELAVPRVETDLAKMIADLAQFEMRWRNFFAYANITPHYVHDRDIADNPVETVQAIAAMVGVQPDLEALREFSGQAKKYARHSAQKIQILENDLPALTAMAFDPNTYGSKRSQKSKRPTRFQHMLATFRTRPATKS